MPENEEIQNWTRFEVSFDKAKKLIDVYNKFLISFSKHFTYDENPLLFFKPNRHLSSGEFALYDLFSIFYDLRYKIDKKIESGYIKYGDYKDKNIIMLLDEADLGFHPLWKKKYINSLIKIIPKIFVDKKIQIIFTTHDPLTLSDIPNSNITYLNKVKDKTIIDKKDRKTFGANINDLLEDSFFVEDSLMGEFAEEKIKEVIKWITNIKDKVERPKNFLKELEENKKIVSIIGESVVRFKLAEMLDEISEENDNLKDKLIDEEIKFLKSQRTNQK